MKMIVIGAALVIFQIMALLGNIQSRSFYYFDNVHSIYSFIYCFVMLIFDNTLGIIGIALLNTAPSGTGFFTEYSLWKMEEKGQLITIKIADDVMNSVLDSGDLIRLSGTVIIANDTITLDNCEYKGIS